MTARLWHYRRAAEQMSTPLAAVSFACIGRGSSMYGEPNVDSGIFGEVLPGIPLVGLACNGEIGPVGHQTHLHGYTSCIAMISERDPILLNDTDAGPS